VQAKTYMLAIAISVCGLFACTPRIELAMPDEPITINLNVKIDHEIRVKVDKELDDLFGDDTGLF